MRTVARVVRYVLSAALFAGWAWVMTLLLTAAYKNWLEFSCGTVFGLVLMGTAVSVANWIERREKRKMLQYYQRDDAGED